MINLFFCKQKVFTTSSIVFLQYSSYLSIMYLECSNMGRFTPRCSCFNPPFFSKLFINKYLASYFLKRNNLCSRCLARIKIGERASLRKEFILNQNHRDWLCVRFLIVIECVRVFGPYRKTPRLSWF